jgi:hypothetical protein
MNKSYDMSDNHLDKSVEEVLAERETTYGSFEVNSAVAQDLKSLIHEAAPEGFPLYMLEALDQIASKMSRILVGNPYYKDSWKDIAGYAKLVEDLLE